MAAQADQSALVVIDMQPHYVERNWRHDRPKNMAKLNDVLHRQRELVRAAKAQGRPIVIVENSFHSPTFPELRAEIGDYSKTTTVFKSGNDMFCRWGTAIKDLRAFLDRHFVDELVIAGANGGACVQDSIEGAIQQGYRIWADSEGIIDFNRQTFIHPFHYEVEYIALDQIYVAAMLDQGDALPRFERGGASWNEGPPEEILGIQSFEHEMPSPNSCHNLLEDIDVMRHSDLLADLMDATSYDAMIEASRRAED